MSDRRKKAIEYIKSDSGKAWFEVLREICNELQVIARKKTVFIRYSVICGIYSDDDI